METLSDLQSEVDAYATAEDGAPPTRWTGAHVGKRLIDAFGVIHRSVVIPGPKAPRAAWPQIVGGWRELTDEDEQAAIVERERRFRARSKTRRNGRLKIDWRSYVDRDTVRRLEADAADDAMRHGEAPMAIEIELADEAIAWPLRFLAESPLHADALQLWALSQALGFSLAGALRKRALKAEAMIQARARGGVAATRADVMPGKVTSQSTLDRLRKHGANLLADRLRCARVAVR